MAEQERKRILERQRQGVAIAKKEGKYKGVDNFYPPNLNHRDKYHRIMQLLNEGKPITHIATEVGVSRNTTYRVKKDFLS